MSRADRSVFVQELLLSSLAEDLRLDDSLEETDAMSTEQLLAVRGPVLSSSSSKDGNTAGRVTSTAQNEEVSRQNDPPPPPSGFARSGADASAPLTSSVTSQPAAAAQPGSDTPAASEPRAGGGSYRPTAAVTEADSRSTAPAVTSRNSAVPSREDVMMNKRRALAEEAANNVDSSNAALDRHRSGAVKH